MIEKEKIEGNKNDGSKVKGIIAISFLALALSLLVGTFVYKFTSGYFEQMAMVKRSSAGTKNVEVMLPDGSKVWLNSKSEIRYPKEFAPNIREVFFEGEAFFAVVKNEEKPFIVHSINSRVEIVGTTFALRAYPEEKDLTLTVVSGEVILFDEESDKNAIQLEKGERGVFVHQSRKISRFKNNDINYLGWQTGKFFFKNTPLSEVVSKLNTYYETPIVIGDEILKPCLVSLDINKKEIHQVLEDIKKLIKINYQQVKGKIIITGKSC